MTTTDFIARICLLTTQKSEVILFMLGCYYLHPRKDVFVKTMLIIAFTLVLNPYLKSIFQAPMDPSLGKTGFAFPSGHMQTAITLWAYLTFEFNKKWLYAVASIILLGAGWAMLHFHYHNITDMLGALGFALLVITLYRRFHHSKYAPLTLILLATPLFFLPPHLANLNHMSVGLGALVGISLGLYTCRNITIKKIHILPALILLACIEFVFAKVDHNIANNFLHFAIIGFTITGGFLPMTQILKNPFVKLPPRSGANAK